MLFDGAMCSCGLCSATDTHWARSRGAFTLHRIVESCRTWPAPLYLGVDFSAGFYGVHTLTLDGNGYWSAGWVNPGLGGLTLGLQALVGPSLQGPLYGTSTPLALILQ